MLYKNVDFGATFWCFVLASLVFYSVLLNIFFTIHQIFPATADLFGNGWGHDGRRKLSQKAEASQITGPQLLGTGPVPWCGAHRYPNLALDNVPDAVPGTNQM